MYRSITTLVIAATTLVAASPAKADLDALLGNWAEEATAEAVLDEEAAKNDMKILVESAERKTRDAANPNRSAATKDRVLTSNHAGSTAVVEDPTELYHVAQPTINPYVDTSSSDHGCSTCDSGEAHSCDAGCGHSGCCGTCSGECGALVAGCMVGQSECRPHHAPLLPPPSTFLQYFNSRNSYSAIWATYAEETRYRCRNRSPHLDGTWQCRGCGALLEPGTANCGCASKCDSGCDAGCSH